MTGAADRMRTTGSGDDRLRIVVGVDFERPSLAAAEWTARHLGAGARLVLVHVAAATAEADDLALRDLAASLGVDAAVEVRRGDPALRLAEAAAAHDAALVVIGAHLDRRSDWDHLGTTAERLVRRSSAPVLVAAGALAGPPRVLVVPVAGDDISEGAFDWARRLGRRFDPKLAVLHLEGAPSLADRPPPADEPSPPRWRRLLADRPAGRVFADAVGGEPAAGILAEAGRFADGLIVVDDRALGAGRRPASDRLLQGGAQSLLVVPEGAAGPRPAATSD